MRLLRNRSDALGWIGIACIGFMWLLMLAPKSMRTLIPVFNLLGPFSWLVPFAMIMLPVIAEPRFQMVAGRDYCGSDYTGCFSPNRTSLTRPDGDTCETVTSRWGRLLLRASLLQPHAQAGKQSARRYTEKTRRGCTQTARRRVPLPDEIQAAYLPFRSARPFWRTSSQEVVFAFPDRTCSRRRRISSCQVPSASSSTVSSKLSVRVLARSALLLG